MRFRLRRFVPIGLLLLALCATGLEAHGVHRRPPPRPFERGFEISTLLVYTTFDDIVEISDDLGFGFRFGYYFTSRHELDVVLNSVRTRDSMFRDIWIDVFNFQVAYIHNFRRDGVVPYLTAGLGFITTDDFALGSETDAVVGVGAGIRFFTNPVFHFRLEYRYNQFEGDGRVFARGDDFNIGEFSFGVGWRFPTR